MEKISQLRLFSDNSVAITSSNNSEWGTFKDSLKAPVHRWFTYPAGFSFNAVRHSFEQYGIRKSQTIYDPYMGSGTTNIEAKIQGINSVGVEAHPFVFRIAKGKLNWEIDEVKAKKFLTYVKNNLESKSSNLQSFNLNSEFPKLILKCYTKEALYDLWALRELYNSYELSSELSNFFFVVITALLRDVSTAATGWPYIAPKKKKITSFDKDILDEFLVLTFSMIKDLGKIKTISDKNYKISHHTIYNDDSRNTESIISKESIDHVFTSPPYLNNFDYADRTRLEMYFWGEASSWSDITKKVRTHLITSATTQIRRTDSKYQILDSLQKNNPKVAEFIEESSTRLSKIRLTKGGRKSYDLLVIGYFNDLFLTLNDIFRVLKPNSYALFVLGDSAPYGVHIPTDEIIGELGLSVGFDSYEIEVLRQRGGKWGKNPQRHSVKLRESILKLKKV